MNYKTKRYYYEFWSKEKYNMFQNSDTHELSLVNEKTGEVLKNFYCCAFNATTLKFWDKSEIQLPQGEFLILNKLNPIIAKKFTGLQKRFVAFKN